MLIRNDLIQSKPNMEIDHRLENHKKTTVSHEFCFNVNEIYSFVVSTVLLHNPYQSIKQNDNKKYNICIILIPNIGHPPVKQRC